MKYSVTIHTEEDLLQSWTDVNCPNMAWGFDQHTLEECLQEDGTYAATYESLEIPQGETLCFTYLTPDGPNVYHLEGGEYGVKPE
jgi:hypothetical protein